MTCFFCKKVFRYYQPLDANRKRFMRKVYPNFKDSSYLCLKCFDKFDTVYRKKKKKSVSNVSDVSIRTNTLSVVTAASKVSTDSSTDQSKENTQFNGKNVVEFVSQSFTSNTSIDSTDRLVVMTAQHSSLNESASVTPHPEVLIAATGARRAVMSALRRKRIRENESSPEQSPAGRRRPDLHVVGDDDEPESPSISSVDLAHVQPIVKRRREPVVHLNQDVMDIYLANTSGG